MFSKVLQGVLLLCKEKKEVKIFHCNLCENNISHKVALVVKEGVVKVLCKDKDYL